MHFYFKERFYIPIRHEETQVNETDPQFRMRLFQIQANI